MKPIKIAILADHFIQYQAPLFRELAKYPEIITSVYYISDHGREPRFDPEFGLTFRWDLSLDTGYDWQLLPGAKGARLGERSLLLGGAILMFPLIAKADLIMFLVEYRKIAVLSMLYLSTLLNIPLIYRGDTTLLHENNKYRKIKRTLLRPVFRRNVWGLSVGKLAKEYISDLSVPKSRIIDSPHSVDTFYWQEKSEQLRNKNKEMKKRFCLPDDTPVISFVGKLTEKKRPLDYAEAVCRLSSCEKLSALVVGDGPLKPLVLQKLHECATLTYHFTGFLNQVEIANAYAASDILCLPSSGSETWGLVINEGMYFDCVPVVSNLVGCGPDLVEGVGEIFPVGDIDGLVDAIKRVIVSLSDRKQKVKPRIEQYSLNRSVQSIVNASKSAYQEVNRKSKT